MTIDSGQRLLWPFSKLCDMNSPLRVLIASDNSIITNHLCTCLSEGGHQVVGVAEDGRSLRSLCRELIPDLVVSQAHLPFPERHTSPIDQISSKLVPVILIRDPLKPEAADWAEHAVFGYLANPVEPDFLFTVARLARQRFTEFEAIRRELEGMRKALHDRKLIEQAKGILMRNAQIGEEEAFCRLQSIARASNRKMIDIASSILTAEQAYQTTDK
jgi:response regulator NasT